MSVLYKINVPTLLNDTDQHNMFTRYSGMPSVQTIKRRYYTTCTYIENSV